MERKVLKDNPFYHVVSLSRQQWVKTIVFGIFLVPLRVTLWATLLTLTWLPYCSIFLLLVGNKSRMTHYEEKFLVFFFWALGKIAGISLVYEGNCQYVKVVNIIL